MCLIKSEGTKGFGNSHLALFSLCVFHHDWSLFDWSDSCNTYWFSFWCLSCFLNGFQDLQWALKGFQRVPSKRENTFTIITSITKEMTEYRTIIWFDNHCFSLQRFLDEFTSSDEGLMIAIKPGRCLAPSGWLTIDHDPFYMLPQS